MARSVFNLDDFDGEVNIPHLNPEYGSLTFVFRFTVIPDSVTVEASNDGINFIGVSPNDSGFYDRVYNIYRFTGSGPVAIEFCEA